MVASELNPNEMFHTRLPEGRSIWLGLPPTARTRISLPPPVGPFDDPAFTAVFGLLKIISGG